MYPNMPTCLIVICSFTVIGVMKKMFPFVLNATFYSDLLVHFFNVVFCLFDITFKLADII